MAEFKEFESRLDAFQTRDAVELELKKKQFDAFLKEYKILVYSVLTFCLCVTYLESYKCFCLWLTVPRKSFDKEFIFSFSHILKVILCVDVMPD